MKRLALLFAIVIAAGCQQVELPAEMESAYEKVDGPDFCAQVEAFGDALDTRTALADGKSVVWSEDDQLAIFQGLSVADKYQVKSEYVGSRNGTFEIVAKGEGKTSELPVNVAIYPYEGDLECTPVTEEGIVTSYHITGVTLPAVQTYSPNTFADEALLMATLTAGLDDRNLRFKNLCGVLKLQLKGTSKIKTIELQGNNNEVLSGDATIVLGVDGSLPTMTMSSDASATVSLDCGNGVLLNEETATTFLIAIPPTDFQEGFNVTITDVDGGIDRIVTSKPNNVGRSVIHTMPERTVKTEKPSMACLIKGNDVYVRAKNFSQDKDFVWFLRKKSTSANRFFNIQNTYNCPTSLADEAMTIGNFTQWKTSSDDICPILINGSHIGGNHGHNSVDKVTASNHGKTNADIGSVWTDSKGKTYVLVFIYDVNTLGFVMFDDKSMADGRMVFGRPEIGTEMIHKSGAANVASVLIENRVDTQLWKCSNHEVLRLYVDGVEVDMSKDQIIHGRRVEFLTEYDVIYVPAMLNYLMDNVGNNTAESQHSEDITENYLRMSILYQFNRNGSISQYNSYTINKDLALGYSGLVQSMAFSSSPYIYSPDTIYDDLILHNTTENSYYLYKKTWRVQDKVPYRYYQFTDASAGKGMCLAYDRSVGWGANDIRLNQITYAGRYKGESKKMYPVLIDGGELKAGTSFDGLACRIPLHKYDEDMTSVAWYWCGDDIILMLDSHNPVDKDIILPDYMNNCNLEVLDKTETVTTSQQRITSNTLRYTSTAYGYLVVRLYNLR